MTSQTEQITKTLKDISAACEGLTESVKKLENRLSRIERNWEKRWVILQAHLIPDLVPSDKKPTPAKKDLRYPNSGQRWTDRQIKEFSEILERPIEAQDMSALCGRSPWALLCQAYKMGVRLQVLRTKFGDKEVACIDQSGFRNSRTNEARMERLFFKEVGDAEIATECFISHEEVLQFLSRKGLVELVQE